MHQYHAAYPLLIDTAIYNPGGHVWNTTLTGGFKETTSYYYAGLQRIAMRVQIALQHDVYYLLGDHLGSTNVTLDASGNKIGEMKYCAAPPKRSGVDEFSGSRYLQVPALQTTRQEMTGHYDLPDHSWRVRVLHELRFYDRSAPDLGKIQVTTDSSIRPD